MSGNDSNRQRKRKRKTRAERNQMSRHYFQEPEKPRKQSNRESKEKEFTWSNTYTLRSGRGAFQSSLALADCKKGTAGTITQGRLTRSLGILNFTNAKSSDWIKRGPIPETEAVRKKVESDMKRILNLSEKSLLNSSRSLSMRVETDSGSKAPESKSAVDTEPDVMEVDPSSQSSPVENTTTAWTIQKSESKTASTHTTGQQSTVAEVTPSKSEHSATLSSTSSDYGDESLAPEPPVQGIADKILKELKPKFDKMFPERDIELEIYSDLQKLLKQSSCHSKAFIDDTETRAFLPLAAEPLKLSTPISGTQSITSSTLSACRPALTSEAGLTFSNLYNQGTATVNESNPAPSASLPYPCRNDHGSVIYSKEDGNTSAFTTAYLLSEAQEMEPIIRINVNVDESEDDDNDDVLSQARYNAFLASARELEEEQQRLRQLKSLASFRRMNPSHFSHFQNVPRHQHVIQHSCGSLDDEMTSFSYREQQSRSKPSDWRSSHSARVLDFSDLSGVHPLRSASYSSGQSGHTEQSLYPDRQWHHCSCQAHHLVPSTCRSDSPSCLLYACDNQRRQPTVFSQDRAWSRPPPCTTSTSHCRGKNVPCIGLRLTQSRLKFQSALNSACRMSDRKHSEPADVMDWNDCDNFLSSAHSKDCHGQSCNPISPQHLITRPLSELQTHQADLQKQARDFLDDLDKTSAKLQPGHSSGSYTRHLFRIASPNSNGSPVWIAPVLKDIGLETAGFV